MIELTLPMPPNLANARMHWAKKHSERQRYQRGAILIANTHRPKCPPVRAVLNATLYLHNRMDDDGAIARLKWPIDALVRAGVLVDDNRKHMRLGGIPDQYIDRKNPRIEFRITEVAEWPEGQSVG